MSDIYIYQNGIEAGPYSKDEVTREIWQGTINKEDLWRDSENGEWKPVKELLAIWEEAEKPPLPELPDLKVPLARKLSAYLGGPIGINASEPKTLDYATLVEVTDDYFTVDLARKNGLRLTYPLSRVVHIAEGVGGVEVGGLLGRRTYPLTVEVYHLIVYTGAVGFGFSLPQE